MVVTCKINIFSYVHGIAAGSRRSKTFLQMFYFTELEMSPGHRFRVTDLAILAGMCISESSTNASDRTTVRILDLAPTLPVCGSVCRISYLLTLRSINGVPCLPTAAPADGLVGCKASKSKPLHNVHM